MKVLKKRSLVMWLAIAIGVLIVAAIGYFIYRSMSASAESSSKLYTITESTTAVNQFKFVNTGAPAGNLISFVPPKPGAYVDSKVTGIYANETAGWTPKNTTSLTTAVSDADLTTTAESALSNQNPIVFTTGNSGLTSTAKIGMISAVVTYTGGSGFINADLGANAAEAKDFNLKSPDLTYSNNTTGQSLATINLSKNSAGTEWTLAQANSLYIGIKPNIAPSETPLQIHGIEVKIIYTDSNVNDGFVISTKLESPADANTGTTWASMQISGPINIPANTAVKFQLFASDTETALDNPALNTVIEPTSPCPANVSCAKPQALAQSSTGNTWNVVGFSGGAVRGKYIKFVYKFWRGSTTITPSVYNEIVAYYSSTTPPPVSACTIGAVNPTQVVAGGTATLAGTNFATTGGSLFLVNGATQVPVTPTWTATSAAFTVPTTTVPATYTFRYADSAKTCTGGSLIVKAPTATCTIGAANPTSVQTGGKTTVSGTNFATSGASLFLVSGATKVALPATWTATTAAVTVPTTVAAGNYTFSYSDSAKSCAGGALTVTAPVVANGCPTISNFTWDWTGDSGIISNQIFFITGTNFGSTNGVVKMVSASTNPFEIATSLYENKKKRLTKWSDMRVNFKVPELQSFPGAELEDTKASTPGHTEKRLDQWVKFRLIPANLPPGCPIPETSAVIYTIEFDQYQQSGNKIYKWKLPTTTITKWSQWIHW